MAVDLARRRAQHRDHAEHDEQRAAEDLTAPLERDRQRPSEHDQNRGADTEEHRVSDSKAHGNPESARTLRGGSAGHRRERQGGDTHQMVSAKAMKESQRQRGEEQHRVILLITMT